MPLRDPMPLWNQLWRSAQRQTLPFHTPGHKQGRGILAALEEAWGTEVFRHDLPELPGLDNLLDPDGVIASAQALAAETFHADHTWFLVNGSTVGIMAAILAIGTIDSAPRSTQTPPQILLPRTVHRSAITGLVLSGAQPIFLTPAYDTQWDLLAPLDAERVAAGLAQSPNCAAVFLVSPTYEGLCADVETIASLCHARQIPLIVDEAHGAHFGFHPNLPPRALDCGADVVIQSTHKTLGALTQAAMLHLKGSRIDPQRLRSALNLLHTTSPNYLLLASLDAARYQMATAGEQLWDQVLAVAQQCRTALEQTQIPCLNPKQLPLPVHHWDPSRITIATAPWGLTGFEVDEYLDQQTGVLAELVQISRLTFLFGLGHTPADSDRLVAALASLPVRPGTSKFSPAREPSLDLSDLPEIVTPPCSPRAAQFAEQESVPLEEAIGRISASLVCAYPPGIPLLLPGEWISATAVANLQTLCQSKATLIGLPESEGHRLVVLKS